MCESVSITKDIAGLSLEDFAGLDGTDRLNSGGPAFFAVRSYSSRLSCP